MIHSTHRLAPRPAPVALPKPVAYFHWSDTYNIIKVKPGDVFEVKVPVNQKGGRWHVSPEGLRNVEVLSTRRYREPDLIGRGGFIHREPRPLTKFLLRAGDKPFSGELVFLDGHKKRGQLTVDSKMTFPFDILPR